MRVLKNKKKKKKCYRYANTVVAIAGFVDYTYVEYLSVLRRFYFFVRVVILNQFGCIRIAF